MTEGATTAEEIIPRQRFRPNLSRVRRRGPLLRPARGGAERSGLYGLDLTAGCALGCAFCYVRGTARDPGPDRLLFDPRVVDALGPALDALEIPARRVVLSPCSDPLPPIREVRVATLRVIEELLGRGIEVSLMTRGRVTHEVVALLSKAPVPVHAAVGVASLGRELGRALEPSAPSGPLRLKGLEALVGAGVPVEARIEPLIPGLTDTKENLRPLLRELGRIGVRDVVAHYVFLQPSILPTLRDALAPLGHAERVVDAFEGGPVFSVGMAGATKHLPLDARREGLARLISWGAEFGLHVRTGSAQNPDLPRLGSPAQTEPARAPTRRERRRPKAPATPAAV